MKAFFAALLKVVDQWLMQKQKADQHQVGVASDTEDVGVAVASDAIRQISMVGRELICSFESLQLQAYDDGVGVCTIGYGTTVYPDGRRVKAGDVCTRAQAESFMAHDLKRFEQTVSSAVTVPLNQHQFDALVSLTYNIGQGAFRDSTLLRKLNAKDYLGAAAQFDVWNRGGGRVLQGLVNRRAVERQRFER